MCRGLWYVGIFHTVVYFAWDVIADRDYIASWVPYTGYIRRKEKEKGEPAPHGFPARNGHCRPILGA